MGCMWYGLHVVWAASIVEAYSVPCASTSSPTAHPGPVLAHPPAQHTQLRCEKLGVGQTRAETQQSLILAEGDAICDVICDAICTNADSRRSPSRQDHPHTEQVAAAFRAPTIHFVDYLLTFLVFPHPSSALLPLPRPCPVPAPLEHRLPPVSGCMHAPQRPQHPAAPSAITSSDSRHINTAGHHQ